MNEAFEDLKLYSIVIAGHYALSDRDDFRKYAASGDDFVFVWLLECDRTQNRLSKPDSHRFAKIILTLAEIIQKTRLTRFRYWTTLLKF